VPDRLAAQRLHWCAAMLRLACTAGVLGWAATAVAQPLTQPPIPPVASDATTADPATPPGFVTLDRGDASSRFGIESSYVFLGDEQGGNLNVWRFEGHGQYVDPTSGFGGYIQFPISYLDASSAGSPSQSTSAVGDLELGGLYVPRLATPNFRVVLRAGVTLPTGSISDEDLQSTVYTSVARITDLYLALPQATSLRLAISGLWRYGQLFARVDLGVDVNLSIENSDSADTIMRANVGVGVEVGSLSFSLESTTLDDSSADPGGGLASDLLSTVAVAARFRTGRIDVYSAVVAPVGGNARNLFGDGDDGGATFASALTLGVEGRLR
jgi:hypothetical protein